AGAWPGPCNCLRDDCGSSPCAGFGVGVGVGVGFAGEPRPKKSFNLAPNDHFELGAVSGRDSGLRASGGSGIIPGATPPADARPLSAGGLVGDEPSALEDDSGLGTEPSGSGWAPLGSVPARKISRRGPTVVSLGIAPVAGSMSQTTSPPGSSKYPPSSGR